MRELVENHLGCGADDGFQSSVTTRDLEPLCVVLETNECQSVEEVWALRDDKRNIFYWNRLLEKWSAYFRSLLISGHICTRTVLSGLLASSLKEVMHTSPTGKPNSTNRMRSTKSSICGEVVKNV
jgi:hypothetical protein